MILIIFPSFLNKLKKMLYHILLQKEISQIKKEENKT
jgi:hypothetical protein